MGPPIFAVCSADAGCVALLGSDPFRLYPAGDAPQFVEEPFATWQVISGSPENYLATRPDLDSFRVQVDAYGHTLAQAREIARAIRTAVETVAHVVALRSETREFDTRLYRFSFDVEWFADSA